MRTRLAGFGVAALAATTFGGTVSAQNVPPQFVVSGKAAEQIQGYLNIVTAEMKARTRP